MSIKIDAYQGNPNDHTTPDALDGRWWHYGAYRLTDGYIAPAAGSELARVDVWRAYANCATSNRTWHPPYTELLDLVSESELALMDRRAPYRPARKSESRLLNWAARWGLLGLLPARAEMIRLPMRRNRRHLRIEQYVRRAGVWSSVDVRRGLDRPTSSAVPEAGALVWHWEANELVPTGWEELWADYFGWVRPVLDMRHLLLPNSPDFWPLYGERADLFWRWAARFREAVDLVSDFPGADEAPGEEQQKVNDALYFLESLAEAVGRPPRFATGSTTLIRYPLSPALLCSFAEMFLEDRVRDRRALRCERCGGYYVTSDPRAQYCSKNCRRTVQQRHKRERERGGRRD